MKHSDDEEKLKEGWGEMAQLESSALLLSVSPSLGLIGILVNEEVLTHLSVSIADGFGQRAPSLSIFHLYWSIMG